MDQSTTTYVGLDVHKDSIDIALADAAMGDHIVILIRALLAMASVMALVGGLGLGSAMGVSVLDACASSRS